jgi:hypothetical protein
VVPLAYRTRKKSATVNFKTQTPLKMNRKEAQSIRKTYGTSVFGWPRVSLQIHGDVSVVEVCAAAFNNVDRRNGVIAHFKIKESLLQLAACIRREEIRQAY